MVWPAIIVVILVIWWLVEARQNALYPPEMREQMQAETVERQRVLKAMKDPKYYEKMKAYNPTFTIPEGRYSDTPEGKLEREMNRRIVLVMLASAAADRSAISVRTHPGRTALEVTPCGPPSCDTDRMSPSRPCLELL